MDLRTQLLSRLATPGADTRFGSSYFVGEVSRETRFRPYEVFEVLWALVAEGLVFLDPSGQGSGSDNWHWRLSTVGIQAATNGSWEPQ